MKLNVRKMVSQANCHADNYLDDTSTKWYGLRKAYAEGYMDAYKAMSEELNHPLRQADVIATSVTTRQEGYYSDNFNTYYVDADGKKHLR